MEKRLNNNRPHDALGNMAPIEYKQHTLNRFTNFDEKSYVAYKWGVGQ